LAGSLLTLLIVLASGANNQSSELARIQQGESWQVVPAAQAPVSPVGDEVVMNNGDRIAPYYYLTPAQASAVQRGAAPLGAALRVTVISEGGQSLDELAVGFGDQKRRLQSSLGPAIVAADGLSAFVERSSDAGGYLKLESQWPGRIDQVLEGEIE